MELIIVILMFLCLVVIFFNFLLYLDQDSVLGVLNIYHKKFGKFQIVDVYKYRLTKNKLFIFAKSNKKNVVYVYNFNYILSVDFLEYSK